MTGLEAGELVTIDGGGESRSLSSVSGVDPVIAYLAGLAPGSRRTMREALATLAEALAGKTRTENRIDPRTVPWHLLRRAETGALRAKLIEQRVSPAYGNKILSALRGVLRAAWRLGLMSSDDYNRAVDLEPIRGERVSPGREATPDELRRLFESCREDKKRSRGFRDAALLALAYGGGLRRAEISELPISSFDETQIALRVAGKGNKERLVPLPGWVAGHLRAWIFIRGEEPGPLLSPVNIRGEVIGGAPLGEHAVYMALLRRMRLAGVVDLTPHDFRRTMASELLERSGDVVAVQNILGHSKIETTERYLRRIEKQKRRASEMLPDPTS